MYMWGFLRFSKILRTIWHFCRTVLGSQNFLFPVILRVLRVLGGQQCSGIVWFAAVNTFQCVKLPYICPAQSTRRTELRVTYIFPAYGAHFCASLLIPVQNPSKAVVGNLIRLKKSHKLLKLVVASDVFINREGLCVGDGVFWYAL